MYLKFGFRNCVLKTICPTTLYCLFFNSRTTHNVKHGIIIIIFSLCFLIKSSNYWLTIRHLAKRSCGCTSQNWTSFMKSKIWLYTAKMLATQKVIINNIWGRVTFRRNFCEILIEIRILCWTKPISNSRLQNGGHFVSVVTMTSSWARWRLKSPASRLFTQPFIQTQIKEYIKAPRHWPLCREFTGDRWIPRTKGQ